jgi:CheY-like chemotaxis protein
MNAQDAMPDGGRLSFTLESFSGRPFPLTDFQGMVAEQWVVLRVTDTGTGIAPEIIDHIFDPFFSTKHPTEGKGLGLAQVHGIVHQHGGTITVASQKNQGTTFTIYLPVETELDETAVSVDPAPIILENSLSKGRILLIEVNATVRTALTEVLEDMGYQMTAAGTASEGLTICRQQQGAFDLIISSFGLTDIQSSRLFEICAADYPTIKRVLMTDHSANDEDLLASFQVDGLISKPFNLDQILSTLQSLINKTDD